MKANAVNRVISLTVSVVNGNVDDDVKTAINSGLQELVDAGVFVKGVSVIESNGKQGHRHFQAVFSACVNPDCDKVQSLISSFFREHTGLPPVPPSVVPGKKSHYHIYVNMHLDGVRAVTFESMLGYVVLFSCISTVLTDDHHLISNAENSFSPLYGFHGTFVLYPRCICQRCASYRHYLAYGASFVFGIADTHSRELMMFSH